MSKISYVLVDVASPRKYSLPVITHSSLNDLFHTIQAALVIRCLFICGFAYSRSNNCLFQRTNPPISASHWSFYSRIRNSRSNISRKYLPRITRETYIVILIFIEWWECFIFLNLLSFRRILRIAEAVASVANVPGRNAESSRPSSQFWWTRYKNITVMIQGRAGLSLNYFTLLCQNALA